MINLNDLENGLLGLHPIKTNDLALSAAYLFDLNGLSSGTNMQLSGIKDNDIAVTWNYPINETVKSSYEPQTAADDGAVAISILLINKYLDYQKMTISYIDGKGFDYWLGNVNTETLVFEEDICLEISGINTETKYNTIQKRARSKELRFEKKDIVKKAYISITTFHTPKTKLYLYENGN